MCYEERQVDALRLAAEETLTEGRVVVHLKLGLSLSFNNTFPTINVCTVHESPPTNQCQVH